MAEKSEVTGKLRNGYGEKSEVIGKFQFGNFGFYI
jgi:hypothetical protein